MKKIIPGLYFLLLFNGVVAEIPDTDLMMPKIAAEKNDSARARLVWDCLGTSETDPVFDMQIAEKLLIQSRQLKDPIEEVFALSCLGYDYRAFGDNTKSWKYNLESIAIAERNPNLESKGLANLALALNYEDIADYPKAIELFTKAIDYNKQANFGKVLSICYMSVSEVYLKMNKVDSALIYSQRAYELSMQIKYSDYLGAILQQLGSIQSVLGNTNLAISYYELAVKEGYKMKSPKFINTSYTAIAQYYNEINQKDSAITYAKKAIDIVQNTAFSNMGIYPAKILLDIYRNKNVDSAFKYSEIYRIANDSMFNAKTVQQTQLLAFEENVRQQQLSDEKIRATEQRKMNIQYVLISLGIVIFIMLFLLLSRRIITNHKLIEFFGVIVLLIVFEFLNLILHPFLESITHHSPVLMLLALVCIAALLVPLHHKLQKWSTKILVEKNKTFRLAAAKRTIEKLENRN